MHKVNKIAGDIWNTYEEERSDLQEEDRLEKNRIRQVENLLNDSKND